MDWPGIGGVAERERFQTAHGAGAGGEYALELHAVARQGVEVRREAAACAIRADEGRGQAFHRNQDDVARAFAEGNFIDGGVFFVALQGFGQQLALHAQRAQRGVGGVLRDGAVKLVVIQLIAAHRRRNGEQAVAGKFRRKIIALPSI